MGQWYLSKNGQALGPITKSKLISLIESGDVGHLDLVYQTGDTEWLPIAEVEEFSVFFKSSDESVSKQEAHAQWVLLKKDKSEKGKEYKQLGPFTEDQVLELIDQGKVRFGDFAWKKGLENWVKISEVEEFAKPLPSTPSIDTSIYEDTTPSFVVEETVTEAHKASLTNMVKIERFNQVAEEVVPKTETAPINNEDFVTDSAGEISRSESDIDVNLWSLEPPGVEPEEEETVADKEMLLEPVPREQKKRKARKSSKNKSKSKKTSSKKEKRSKQPRKPMNPETLQWIAAVGVFVVALVFLYLSMMPNEAEVAYDGGESLTESKIVEIPHWKQKQTQKRVRKNEGLERAPKEVTVNNVMSESDSIERKVAYVKPPVESKKKQLKAKSIKEAKPKTKKKKIVKKAKVAKKPKAKVKKKKVAKKAKVVKKVKPKVKAKKKKVIKKAKVAKKPKVKKTPLRATGSNKMKSFFKQRDRKALFYSSLKAETLAVDIQRQYKKLRNNKTAWSKYYSQWRKKVRISLAKDIRNYPVRSQKYAYPKIIESFKKDYALFYKYGDTFDAKVKGARAPSGAPKDIGKVFTRYKNQAQRLGQ